MLGHLVRFLKMDNKKPFNIMIRNKRKKKRYLFSFCSSCLCQAYIEKKKIYRRNAYHFTGRKN